MLQTNLKAFSTIIPIYVYGRTESDMAGVKRQAGFVERLLLRMPSPHVAVIDPIFVVDRFPGGKADDGGYSRPGREVNIWPGRQHNTGVPDADLTRFVLSRPRSGIIGMTANAWASARFERALFHEIAHSVDTHLGLIPLGAAIADFRGVPNPGREVVGEYVAQAYFRFILDPAAICNSDRLAAGDTIPACNARIIQLIRRSPAFRGLAPSWMPGAG